MKTPTTFVTSLRQVAAVAPKGATITIQCVTDAPIWHDGDIVATFTGSVPVITWPVSGHFVTLLDNGSLSAIAGWRLPA